jgi:cysteine desulfurase
VSPIYLDHNATTPVHPAVLDAMLPYLREHFGNPSSGHIYGQRARAAVERAREQVASLLACQPDEIVFTSGGTEANNLAIRGVLELASPRRHIVNSTVEHPATTQPCELLERHGAEVTRLPVDGFGRVRVDDARPFVRSDTALVTVMLAQNEVGTLMPVAELAGLAHERGALIHTDAAQAVGKIPTRVDELRVDLLSIAGHKIYAPKGVGALFVRRGTPLAPVLAGAGHERGLRPGTENVPFIVGLGAACELAAADLDDEADRQRALRDELWDALREAIAAITLNGHPAQRVPNTLNVSFPGVRGCDILARAPEIAASTGSACHEGADLPSPVLLAMGVDAGTALGAIRLSLGRGTTRQQVRQAARSLVKAFREVGAVA